MATRFLTLSKWFQIFDAGNQTGLWALLLDCFQRKGNTFDHIGRLVVNSGAPHRQYFRKKKDQRIGELEPIPEGIYPLANSPLSFASGVWGDYSKRYNSIDSPVSQTIEPNRAIEFHLDGNREWAPGSAGCVVFRSMNDLKTFVSWFDKDPLKMSNLFVNWNLGSVHWPAGLVIPEKPEIPE